MTCEVLDATTTACVHRVQILSVRETNFVYKAFQNIFQMANKEENGQFVPEPVTQLITADFLQFVIGDQVKSLSVSTGTKFGDNYMSSLYSISARVVTFEKEEERHYMIKSYPSHPSRQQYLKNANHFHKELTFYTKWAKELISFQTEILDADQVIVPAFPPCVGGKAIDFEEVDSNGNPKSVSSPLDNFILMVDLKKTFGFRMADRTTGLDEAHVKLAVKELAIMHALSWAYRKRVEWNLANRFPTFKKPASIPGKTSMWLGILAENVGTATSAIRAVLGGDSIELEAALTEFQKKAEPVIEYFGRQDEMTEVSLGELLRDPSKFKLQNDEPWRVICHGDCWTNNLLYQYDCQSPNRVVLLDFPVAKLGCPTLDLACLIYTSTRQSFRQTHLQSCLQLYCKEFTQVCDRLLVESLPHFGLDTLQQKFHRSKLVGFLIALISLPMNLIGPETELNFDGMTEGTNFGDMLQQASAIGVKGKLYQEWVLELIQEMRNEGVI